MNNTLLYLKINEMELENNVNVGKMYDNGFNVITNNIDTLENKNNLNYNINNNK